MWSLAEWNYVPYCFVFGQTKEQNTNRTIREVPLPSPRTILIPISAANVERELLGANIKSIT